MSVEDGTMGHIGVESLRLLPDYLFTLLSLKILDLGETVEVVEVE